jgi:hypothetical protein
VLDLQQNKEKELIQQQQAYYEEGYQKFGAMQL